MDILVQDNKAHELFPNSAPELHADLVVVKDYVGDVEEGWDWNGTEFTAPPAPPEPTYGQLRARAYPSIQEQLDMQYWDGINGTTTWADAIAAVKAQYPKPE